MAKKREKKVVGLAYKRIDADRLDNLRKIKRNLDIVMSKAEAVNAAFRHELVEAIDGIDEPIDITAVCLICGYARPRSEPCPKCPPPTPSPSV